MQDHETLKSKTAYKVYTEHTAQCSTQRKFVKYNLLIPNASALHTFGKTSDFLRKHVWHEPSLRAMLNHSSFVYYTAILISNNNECTVVALKERIRSTHESKGV